MKLFLVRHGEYIPESVNPDKPLSDKGKSDIKQIGQQLKNNGYVVEEIFHSGKLRAKQTAEILAEYVLKTDKISQQEGLNPNDEVKPWAEKIASINHDLMIVGHLPFMQSLSGLLLEGDEIKLPIRFYEGTAAVLEKTSKKGWRIITIF
ncbi:phosphohistidine phosphatase SixA [Candidatus Peregrinibacteria bacterium]|nr:phosphohistidine phosphatase SixA [Candidatus Peregrinibacteria bacterium]